MRWTDVLHQQPLLRKGPHNVSVMRHRLKTTAHGASPRDSKALVSPHGVEAPLKRPATCQVEHPAIMQHVPSTVDSGRDALWDGCSGPRASAPGLGIRGSEPSLPVRITNSPISSAHHLLGLSVRGSGFETRAACSSRPLPRSRVGRLASRVFYCLGAGT